MRDYVSISGIFETTEFEIAQVACIKITPDSSKNESGLTQMIMMSKSVSNLNLNVPFIMIVLND